MEVEPRIAQFVESVREDLGALIELLEIEVLKVRASCYFGIELVVAWQPNFRMITVVHLSSRHHRPLLLYSAQPFRGATQECDGSWVLEL